MSAITEAIQRIFEGYHLEPDDSMALTRAKTAVEELERTQIPPEIVERVATTLRDAHNRPGHESLAWAVDVIELLENILAAIGEQESGEASLGARRDDQIADQQSTIDMLRRQLANSEQTVTEMAETIRDLRREKSELSGLYRNGVRQ